MESEVQGVPFLDSSKFLREVFLRAWKPFLIHKIFGTVFESGANKNLTWINSGSKAFYNGFTMDQIYIVRGGPTFGAVKYVKEQSHVNHVHANSLLIHLNFSSKSMITWPNLFENSLLIRFQTDRKLTFDPVRTNEGFELLIYLHWFELDQKWVFEQIGSRDHLYRREIQVDQKWAGFTGPKVGPSRNP